MHDEKTFTVLIPIGFPKSGPGLLALAQALAPRDHRLVIKVLHVATGERWQSMQEAAEDVLGLLRTAAQERGLAIECIAASGRDVGARICDTAREHDADVILLGWHRPGLERSIVGGIVTDVMRAAPVRTIVCMERGEAVKFERVLVPYLTAERDLAAIETASALAEGETAGRQVTVLHMVEPDEDPEAVGPFRASLRSDGVTTVKVVPTADPLQAVIDEASNGYDVVVIGSSRTWGVRPGFFGLRHERLARDTSVALLIVHDPVAPPAARSRRTAAREVAPA